MSWLPHPVVRLQLSVPQPNLLVLAMCLFVPGWLPTLLTYALMHLASFAAFHTTHGDFYQISFLIIQLVLVSCSVIFLSLRYTAAVWMPQTFWQARSLISLVILLPLLLVYLSDNLRGVLAIIKLTTLLGHARAAQELASTYKLAWGRLAFGSSFVGIICSSIVSFSVPLLEELVFTGFVLNAIARSYGFIAAVVGTSACFSIVHVFHFGLGTHLIYLFFAGVTYQLLRISSGSLWLAVFAHFTINAVVFLPKWMLAVLHFTKV